MKADEERLLAFVDRADKFFGDEIVRPAHFVEEGATTRVQLPFGGRYAFLLLVAMVILIVATSMVTEIVGGPSPQGRYWTLARLFGTLTILGGLSAAILALNERIIISSEEVVLSYGIGVFRRKKNIRIEDVRSVAVRAFAFANWDMFVAIQTEGRTFRIAWSVSQETARAIADAITRRLPGAAA